MNINTLPGQNYNQSITNTGLAHNNGVCLLTETLSPFPEEVSQENEGKAIESRSVEILSNSDPMEELFQEAREWVTWAGDCQDLKYAQAGRQISKRVQGLVIDLCLDGELYDDLKKLILAWMNREDISSSFIKECLGHIYLKKDNIKQEDYIKLMSPLIVTFFNKHKDIDVRRRIFYIIEQKSSLFAECLLDQTFVQALVNINTLYEFDYTREDASSSFCGVFIHACASHELYGAFNTIIQSWVHDPYLYSNLLPNALACFSYIRAYIKNPEFYDESMNIYREEESDISSNLKRKQSYQKLLNQSEHLILSKNISQQKRVI